MKTTSHFRASRTAAALGTVLAAAALALGAAGPAQALTCPAGYDLVIFNNVQTCSPRSTGGVGGGGTVVVGGGGSTVPGGAAPIVGGSGGAPLQPAPYVPAPAPYVPPAPVPAPVYAPAPAQVYVPSAPAPAPGPNQPVKGVAPAENPVIEGVPAEGPAADDVPTETTAVAPETAAASATLSARPSPSVTPSAEPIRSEQTAATDNGTAPGFIIGSLVVLAVAAGAVCWLRLRKAKTGKM